MSFKSLDSTSETLVGYHATDHNIEKLVYRELVDNITNHINGALGLWCADDSSWITGFGSRKYRVVITGLVYDMDISELVFLNNKFSHLGEYTVYRSNKQLQGYDAIRVIENDGRSDMFIVLNFDKAKIKYIGNL